MGESVDVRALRARFHAKADLSSSRDSTSPISPLPGFGAAANGAFQQKRVPIVPTPPPPGSSSSPDFQRLPPRPIRAELDGLTGWPRPTPSPQPYGATKELPRPGHLPLEIDRQVKARVSGELLQNIMLKHKGVPSTPTKTTSPYLPSQRSLMEVTPLRRALPPEGLRPVKPKRPPHVNLHAHQRNSRSLPPTERPELRRTDGGSSLSLPGLVSPSVPARLPAKPSSLTRQRTPANFEDDYDDIDVKPPPPPPKHPGSWDKSDSITDHSSEQIDEGSDDSEIYDMIDENNEQEVKMKSSEKKKKMKELKQQQEQGKREQKERQERENKYRKKFKLEPGKIEVLHMAKVRHDWQGGKSDLNVRQGDSVEIIRVKNNPGGRWLARTPSGHYGYIINTCVEVDYEEVKRKLKLNRATDVLPPPPPSPPGEDNDIYYDVESSNNMNSSMTQEDDDYDDVQNFPPPPPDISLNPKMKKKLEKDEQEFRKKFKFEGPINVLHIMMVDANIKKAGAKDLPVDQGEILEVIQLTNDKKALCRNMMGKYGYVPRNVLLQAEGDDIYDDIDHNEMQDNDNVYDDAIH
ncbi:hypothetical protein DPEC_G00271350 [Dallia pectoralis]|uniref:Uncharacterized protein n=1 Tax=Dallia pectoralis TaxID=75939 RepID=A0ACC2FPK5_DALPE|nr:hypothetical protein DPEC_G00271350 [Dallia pectoralis]